MKIVAGQTITTERSHEQDAHAASKRRSPNTTPFTLRLLCKPGFEACLQRELVDRGFTGAVDGPGLVLATIQGANLADAETAIYRLCFPFLTLGNAQEFHAPSVNTLADRLLNHFLDTARGEAFASAS